MKLIFNFLTFSILIFICSSFFPKPLSSSDFMEIENGKTMCSSLPNVATCTGSAYCRACKNCKYCKYCNNGGSCGVCGKKPRRSYSTPKPRKQTKSYSPKISQPKEKYSPPKAPAEYSYPVYSYNNTYTVIKKTSLRKSGNSKAPVLKRLQVKEEVIVLNQSNKYWWMVKYNNKIGWVKKHLLEKAKPKA